MGAADRARMALAGTPPTEDAMEIGTRSGWTEPHAAGEALRLHVRHGAAGLLAAEALLVLAWALLWATFLVA